MYLGLIGLLVVLLIGLAWCIETVRHHWLTFDELPIVEQERLLLEAKKTVYTIGSFTGSPDPRAVLYYTKLSRRRT